MTEAVIAALDAAGVPAAVGGRPTTAAAKKPFVVIWPDGPVRTAAKLNDSLGTETTVLVCHCAGLTPEAAAIAERALFAAVTSLYRTEVDGRFVDRMPAQDWAQPLHKDEVVSPPLYDLPVTWRIRTSPA